jgi:hypothetical protein
MLLVFLGVFFIILPSTLFLLDHWKKKIVLHAREKEMIGIKWE